MNKILSLAVILLLAGIASAGTSYVHGNGQTIAKINDTGIYYYHPDHLGSTSAMTNNDGEVVEEQTNLPFGEQISGGERYGFTGKELDETGLNYFGARYYSPLTGRFLTVDSAMDGVNWYSYANNNPLKYIDPSGNTARIAVDMLKKTITISLDVYVMDSNPSQGLKGQDMYELAMNAIKIERVGRKYWDGHKYTPDGKYSYMGPFDVILDMDAEAIDYREENKFERKSKEKDREPNFIDYAEPSSVGSLFMGGFVARDNFMRLGSDSEKTIAHELGHLLGANDQYVSPPLGCLMIPFNLRFWMKLLTLHPFEAFELPAKRGRSGSMMAGHDSVTKKDLDDLMGPLFNQEDSKFWNDAPDNLEYYKRLEYQTRNLHDWYFIWEKSETE